MTPTLSGRLLIASPTLVDPNFARAVVLVLEHGEPGAVGVVLNRPTSAPVAEFLEDWADLAADPPVVFVGGPVQREIAVGLAQGTGEVEGHPVFGAVTTVDLGKTPGETGPLGSVRVFSGYAGWDGEQLEDELAEGAWFVVSPAFDDVFTSEPDSLWQRVLRRQRGWLAMFASYPIDPSLN